MDGTRDDEEVVGVVVVGERKYDVVDGSTVCRKGDATRCREEEFRFKEENSGISLRSSVAILSHIGYIRDEPGDPDKLPQAPPLSLPGVTAPEGGDLAYSSYAEDRRLSPGV